jgi:hypothetical protein
MSYLLIKIHSFTCDYPDCPNKEEPPEQSKRVAVKKLRGRGWYITADRINCPWHWPSWRDAP